MTFTDWEARCVAAIKAERPLTSRRAWPLHFASFDGVWSLAAFDVIIATGIGKGWSLRWRPYGIWRGGRGAGQ